LATLDFPNAWVSLWQKRENRKNMVMRGNKVLETQKSSEFLSERQKTTSEFKRQKKRRRLPNIPEDVLFFNLGATRTSDDAQGNFRLGELCVLALPFRGTREGRGSWRNTRYKYIPCDFKFRSWISKRTLLYE
jgi:hypothetical protein